MSARWRLQPTMEGGVTITVTGKNGQPIVRNLYGFEFEDSLYVSSNHWFRRWYNAARKNPDVRVTREGVTRAFTAVAVRGAEHHRVLESYVMGPVLRLICGFAPSRFLRLEPAL